MSVAALASQTSAQLFFVRLEMETREERVLLKKSTCWGQRGPTKNQSPCPSYRPVFVSPGKRKCEGDSREEKAAVNRCCQCCWVAREVELAVGPPCDTLCVSVGRWW